ncbi:MAG: PKD domain-containing protein, partial [Bacteroidota bacterium]
HDHDDDEGCHGHEGNTPTIVRFVENKQQWEPHIRYAAEIPRGKVYFEDGKLTYLLANLSHLHDAWFHSDKPRNEIQIPIEGHAWYMHFEGANPSPELVSDQRYPDYNNYFIGDDPEKWASKVGIFGTVTYQNLYPGVNLKFYGKTNSLKYDVELAANADPNQVKFRYEGLDGMELVDGMLVMKTILGEVTEMAPYAYQSIDGRQVEVPCEFVLNGEVVSFGFPNGYDESLPLVIDPNLIFGSYTGSTADNFGYTATYDTSGNLYGGGIVFGMGYPVTPGAFQDTFQGGVNGLPFPTGFDISISKFNPTGTALVWSTYLGGTTSNEQPHSLITNDDAELVVYGRTWSTDYPVTAGAVQAANAGISDIVVTRLNAAGAGLIGSTYMGGTANDGLNIQTIFAQNGLYYNYGDDARGEVMLDDQDNIYIASCTQSNNFPVTAGVVQPAFGGGLQDGCVFKLNPNCTALLWSTYLGGAANDAAYSVKVSATNEPYVTGGTESADFPTTPGVVQTALAGGIDGFITRLNPTATGITASTFLGTSAYDQCYFLELDAAQNAYVIGQTRGNWPVTPGVYSNPNGNQFIARYDANLQNTGFSTVFGAGQNAVDISPTAFLVDRCGFIYVSGWGGSTNYEGDVGSLPVTSDAFQDSTANDSSDMYLLVLEPDAVGLEYASYYGGPTSAEHVDGGTSRFDKNLIVYQAVCAGCLFANNDFPTTPGVVSQTNNSNNCNLGVFKFAFEPQDVIAAYIATTFDSCAPFPVSFTNNSQGGVAYIWDYGDGSPLDTTFNAFHLYQVPGTYTVTLVAVDSNSCNFSDTSVQTVTVFANPIALAGGADTTCAGGAVQLTSGGGQFYDWSPGIWLSDSTIANPIANPQTDIVYEVIVRDTNGCTDTATVAIEVSEFEADAGPPTSFCEGTGGAQLMAGAINGGTSPYYYTWWCDSTNTFCGLDSMFDNDPIANPTQTTWYYLQVQDSRGCLSNIDSVLVEVLPVPIADAGADVGICQPPAPGVVLNGSFTNAPGPFTYYWIPGTGLNDSTLLNPYARPDTTTIYTLVGLSANGCSSNPTTTDTLSTVTVTVHPMPIAEAGPDLHVCATDSQIIQGFGSNAGPLYDFEWSPSTGLSDSTIANPIGSPPFTHEYILTVWSNGCPSIGDTMTLWVHTLPTPSAGNIQEICLGDSAYLDAFGAGDSSAFYTYEWMPGASMSDSTAENPAASPDTTTWYYLTVTSSWGCESP